MPSDQTQIFGSLSQTRDDEVEACIRSSQSTRQLHLSHLQLITFPLTALQRIINKDSFQRIYRLDLSNNHLMAVPSLSSFVSLRELWLQRNPIDHLPDIAALKKLEVIDISYTSISDLPPYLSTLTSIFEISWTATPLSERMRSKHGIDDGDIYALFDIMRQEFKRIKLEDEFKDAIERFYLSKGDAVASTAETIVRLIAHLRESIPDFEDFQLFVRRAPSLLPDRIERNDNAFVAKAMNSLQQFRRDTKRQRLSADLDIALRNVYFDRIERESVEQVISSIYNTVSLLEDIEFLIKYAVQILPSTPEEALNGELVWKNIVSLQSQLTQKRQVRHT